MPCVNVQGELFNAYNGNLRHEEEHDISEDDIGRWIWGEACETYCVEETRDEETDREMDQV